MAEDMEAPGIQTGMSMDIRIAKCSVRGHLQLYLNETKYDGLKCPEDTLPDESIVSEESA